MKLPSPELEADWKVWARRVVAELAKPTVVLPAQLPTFSLATLPKATPSGQVIMVVDDFEGNVPAYSDGADWRRFSDDEVVG